MTEREEETFGYNVGLHINDTSSRRGEPIDTDSRVQLERARTLPSPTLLIHPLTIPTYIYSNYSYPLYAWPTSIPVLSFVKRHLRRQSSLRSSASTRSWVTIPLRFWRMYAHTRYVRNKMPEECRPAHQHFTQAMFDIFLSLPNRAKFHIKNTWGFLLNDTCSQRSICASITRSILQ